MKAFAIGLALVAASVSGAACAERGGSIPPQYAEMVARHAKANGVPEALVHRIIMRESRYNPKARNGPYWGMMQMSVATARGAGFRGSPSELLDADTNMRFGVRYLAGAYKTARGDHGRAVGFYARGYYYAAKRQGLLASIGMGRDGKFSGPPPSTSGAAPTQVATAPAEPVLASVAASPRTAAPMAPQKASGPVATAWAAIPTPPVRGPAAAPGAQTVAAASAVPLPPTRGPGQQVAAAKPAGPRTIDASAAPVMASIAPVPRPRDEPRTTGSVPARESASPRSGATAPQVVAQPTMAGPAIPLPTARDQKPGAAQPALAYAESGKTTATPIPQPRGPVAPLPPRR